MHARSLIQSKHHHHHNQTSSLAHCQHHQSINQSLIVSPPRRRDVRCALLVKHTHISIGDPHTYSHIQTQTSTTPPHQLQSGDWQFVCASVSCASWTVTSSSSIGRTNARTDIIDILVVAIVSGKIHKKKNLNEGKKKKNGRDGGLMRKKF